LAVLRDCSLLLLAESRHFCFLTAAKRRLNVVLAHICLTWPHFICLIKGRRQLKGLGENSRRQNLRSELVLFRSELLNPFVGVHTRTIFVSYIKLL